MNPILTLGPLNVTPFGLVVLAGALCGVLLSLRKKENGPVLPFVILGALLIGHMWWVFFCPPGYTAQAGTAAMMLRIWDGGYTLYGALFGGFLGAVIGAKLSRLDLVETLDSLAPGACAALIFCRLGEYFTGQGYGDTVYDEGLWFLPVSFCTAQEEGYQEWSYAVWAWEAIAALILLVLLLLRARKAVRGQQTVLFVTGLGASQILLEQMRIDDFVRLNPFVRFSQIAALLSLIAVLILLTARRRPGRKAVIASFAELVFASLAIAFAEFVFEKPQFLPAFYASFAACVIGLGVLLRVFREKRGIPAFAVFTLASAVLLAVYIADQWQDGSWLLYGMMALALIALSAVVYLNARRQVPARD